MLSSVKRTIVRLAKQTSGNAVLLVAAGMPALIGAAGLGVDTAQWFMWKREMQYAADQAALAGAWSLVGGSTGETYKTRAKQELSANLQQANFAGLPTVAKAPWPAGNSKENSVVVTVSATKTLPFSAFLTKKGVTISAKAQATFQQGRMFTSCLIAVDPHTRGAIVIGGNAYVVAGCGAAALSDDPDAVIKNGNGVFDVGWIVSEGGIDDAFNDGKTEIFENQTGLEDPFANLSPPNSPTPQVLQCSGGGEKYVGAVDVTAQTTFQNMTSTNGNTWRESGSPSQGATGYDKTSMIVPKQAQVGDTIINTTSTEEGPVTSKVSGNKTTYYRTDTVTTRTGKITAITYTMTPAGAYPRPGTYTAFEISCDTVMSKGVFVIDGGMLSINAQNKLIGEGVMFVLKNGAGIRINGGSNVFLRPMTFSEMVDPAAGNMTNLQATNLKGMLIFEDRNSSGDAGDKINGTSDMGMNGTIYLPKSTVTFSGTSHVTVDCFVIAAARIVIEGTANMTSFCADNRTNTGIVVGGGANTVKLVS